MRPGAMILISSLLLVACGGSDPGNGSKTLYVEALAQTDGSGDGTFLRVFIRQGSSTGDLVEDATVTMRSERGTEYALPWVGAFGVGAYFKNDIPWEPGWRMKISRGNNDRVEAYLSAPGITVITEPPPNASYSRASGQPLVVRWRDESGRRAEGFELKMRRASSVNIARPEDPGTVQIDPGNLVSSTDERIELSRTNQIPLNGGVAGSTFKAVSVARVLITVN